MQNKIILVLLVAFFFTSCIPTRNIERGKYLCVRKAGTYQIKGDKLKDVPITIKDLMTSNQKVFMMRLKLRSYNFGTRFKPNSWLNRTFVNSGEEPILYDSILHQESAKNIEKYLHTIGYFDAKVYPKIKKRFLNRKAIYYYYEINTGQAYLINKIDLKINDRELKTFIQADLSYSKIKSGEIFSIDVLKAERERIALSLQNTGYYYFSSDQIRFEADSLDGDHTINLTFLVTNLKTRSPKNKDSIIDIPPKRYKINEVYFKLESTENNNETKIDTTAIEFETSRNHFSTFYFIHSGEFEINPKAIIRATYLKPGAFYKKIDILETHKSLSTLDYFKFININIQDISIDTAKNGSLNVIIYLSRKDNYSLSTALEFKNTGGILGIEQSFNLSRNNIFKNAEILNLQLRGAAETQNDIYSKNKPKDFQLFNTFEAGAKMTLDLPRFIIPYQDVLSPRYIKPRTKISTGYNFQLRPDYTRYIVNASYGYFWRPNSRRANVFNPIEISSVKINPSPEFEKIINTYADPKIRYSYQNHLVINARLTHTYKELQSVKPYKYWFYNIDLGGAPYSAIAKMLNAPKDSLGQYTISNIPFSRYFLIENDFRYYFPVGKKMNNAMRIYVGVGVPFGGSKGLPFEKSFYVGGANSLRAWTLGSLGPGTNRSSSNNFEKTGDIKIEMNYEFRFPISGSFEGAIFTDLGNIWLLNESIEQPGGEFTFKTFLNEFAIDFGYGLRYNLDFLIIRVDIGHPLYQPYLLPGARWSSFNSDRKLITGFNFAINYPF